MKNYSDNEIVDFLLGAKSYFSASVDRNCSPEISVVDSNGKLTYHGKAFVPENVGAGSAHVTVLPNGEFRINAGSLTPKMEQALRKGLNAR